MAWLTNTDTSEILSLWAEKIDRLRMLMGQGSSTQEKWRAIFPPEIRGAKGLLLSFPPPTDEAIFVRGGKWITQCIFGFLAAGIFPWKGFALVSIRLSPNPNGWDLENVR